MIRSKTGSILVVAAAALLGIFVVRDSAERTSIERIRVEASGAAAPLVGPVSSLQRQAEDPVEPAAPPGQVVNVPTLPNLGGLLGNQDENLHPGERVDEATVVRLHGDKPLTAEHPHMKSAIEIQERNTAWIMAHPAVVGTAIGLNDKGEVALVVYTKVAAPELPKAIEDLPVAVFVSGEFFARNSVKTQDAVTTRDQELGPSKGPSGGTTVNPKARFGRPVPIGVSTGHPDITAGTIGCRVKDAAGNVYALSNNHVYANENYADLSDPVLQPGPYDGGVSTDKIGTLSDFQEIFFGGAANRFDAAIALCTLGTLGNSTPTGAGYGTPRSEDPSTVLAPALSMPVKKYGRTTAQTTGKVSAINGTVNVGYDGGTARFTGQVFITKGGFSAGGDSGSLIVVNGGTNDRKPVALLFAGSSSTTIGSPIGEILTRFGVSVDGN